MYVFVDGKVYNSEETPIILGFESNEKQLIGNMGEQNVFACYNVDKTDQEQLMQNMIAIKAKLIDKSKTPFVKTEVESPRLKLY